MLKGCHVPRKQLADSPEKRNAVAGDAITQFIFLMRAWCDNDFAAADQAQRELARLGVRAYMKPHPRRHCTGPGTMQHRPEYESHVLDEHGKPIELVSLADFVRQNHVGRREMLRWLGEGWLPHAIYKGNPILEPLPTVYAINKRLMEGGAQP